MAKKIGINKRIRKVRTENGWIRRALSAMRSELVGWTTTPFTSDSMMWNLSAYHGLGRPTNGNDVGALFSAAKRLGMIKPTKMYVPSAREKARGRAIRVWKPASERAIASVIID